MLNASIKNDWIGVQIFELLMTILPSFIKKSKITFAFHIH